jgi:acyl CoA:acetate/3-ketoacid CoA transferase beta subunit
MWRVVTDFGIMGFHAEERRMEVLALHPGIEFDQLQENTGFELVHDSKVRRTEPPMKQELDILRTLDPDRYYTA